MWPFKPKHPHQLVNEKGILYNHYRCAICRQIFYSASSAKDEDEWCPGKIVYDTDMPSHVFTKKELRATGRILRKAQTPAGYVREFTGFSLKYVPVYDAREAQELAGAIPLAREEA